ncbi:32471_t:CDS:1, partial [Racocetra persica]
MSSKSEYRFKIITVGTYSKMPQYQYCKKFNDTPFKPQFKIITEKEIYRRRHRRKHNWQSGCHQFKITGDISLKSSQKKKKKYAVVTNSRDSARSRANPSLWWMIEGIMCN